MIDPKDPLSLPCRPYIIAHDVGGSRDRSTAVIGGPVAFHPHITIRQSLQLPNGRFGSDRAEELREIDRFYGYKTLVAFDVSNDSTYGETLLSIFGPRVIGIHITSSGDGMTLDHRPYPKGCLPVLKVGRTELLEKLHLCMEEDQLRVADNDNNRAAYNELNRLQVEARPRGRVYSCPGGEHDDLAISWAMLVFFAQHPIFGHFVRKLEPRPARRQRGKITSAGWT